MTKLKEIEKEIKKKSSKKIVLTREDLKTILKEAFSEGSFEERKWHETRRFEETSIDDPFYAFYDQENQQELVQHKTSKELIPPKKRKVIESLLGTRVTRTGEVIPSANKHLNQDQLFLFQDAAYLKAHTDPLAKSIIRNKTNFIIGRGVQIDCIVPEIEQCINKFRRDNKIEKLERQQVKHMLISGEFFTKARIFKNGKEIYVSGVSPENVVDIEYNNDNYDDAISFKVLPLATWDKPDMKEPTAERYPSIEYFDQEKKHFGIVSPDKGKFKKNEYIHYMKEGNFDEIRGDPPLRSVLKYLRYAEDFTIDRMRLNHERSKIIMKKKIIGGGTTTQKHQVAPRGGIVLIETENETYEIMGSKIDSADAKEDGLWILYSIGAGVVLPAHILQQRGDQEVYASIKKMDTPFSQDIVAWQDFFDENWDDFYKFIVKQKIKAGELRKQYRVPAYVGLDSGRSKEALMAFMEVQDLIESMLRDDKSYKAILKEADNIFKDKKMNKRVSMKTEDIPITRIFPDVVRENPLEIAKVLFLHKRLGIVSLGTMSQRAGYDWRSELRKKAQEKDLGIDNDTKDDGDDNGKPRDIPREPDDDTNVDDTNIRLNI